MSREIKVGMLVLAALAVLMGGTFLIGEKSNLFTIKNRYFVRFDTVSGLATGSPVQLNGVNVGHVTEIVLPRDVTKTLLTVWVSVDSHYQGRIRRDSLARIKTLGLLGDKYIEITSGSAASPVVPSGGQIFTAPATDVDNLIASGGDVVENVVAISYSLRRILTRMEAGEGLLGELTTDNEAGRRAKQALLGSLNSLHSISTKIDDGEGTLGALINDSLLAARMGSALNRIETLLEKLDSGPGALPTLLNDETAGRQVRDTISSLNRTAEDLGALVTQLRQGDGLLGRLVTDEELGDSVGDNLEELLENLRRLSAKLEEGEGTLAMLIEDPSVYEAINDVIVGVDESKLLRWLIRNRQKSGIKTRYRDEQQLTDGGAATVESTEQP
jgi:phospholipid/cholesterol/gamma-HCH transport system substrate-binding protein